MCYVFPTLTRCVVMPSGTDKTRVLLNYIPEVFHQDYGYSRNFLGMSCSVLYTFFQHVFHITSTSAFNLNFIVEKYYRKGRGYLVDGSHSNSFLYGFLPYSGIRTLHKFHHCYVTSSSSKFTEHIIIF